MMTGRWRGCPTLIAVAQRHGLKVATIADLIAYRRKHDSIVRCVAETKVESAFGGDVRHARLPNHRWSGQRSILRW